jgi:aryl-alcohol dehydrogenase-like predicted oxidoreductase
MERRPLGRTGLAVSALGFGCGNVGGLMVRGAAAEQERAVGRAIEAGVTYFDTAPSYGNGRSEESLGRALRALGAWGRVVVGTKLRVRPDDLGDLRGAVRRSLVASLARLGRQSIDLVQLHNRVGEGPGELPAALVAGEVAMAMRALAEEGLARHIGFTGMGETAAAHGVIRSRRFDTVQAYFNALNPSAGFPGAAWGGQDLAGLIDLAAGEGMGVIAIRVMAAGALSASAERAPLASPGGGGAMVAGGDFESDLARARRLAELAGELGLESPLELGVRFVLAKAGVSTLLVGFSDEEQLEAALCWLGKGPLAADAVERVVALAQG